MDPRTRQEPSRNRSCGAPGTRATAWIAGLAAALVVVTAASWLAFVAAGHAPLDSLFEAVSAVGTVGLPTGITGPPLGDGLKLLLCADMLMGRLEIVAVLVLVYPPTWIARRVEAA